MRILAIETSCDETAISLVEAKGRLNPPAGGLSFKVLGNNLASQAKIHAPYGGVYPTLAKREHIKNLPILFDQTLKQAKLEKNNKPFDLIAVTQGPGLEPALWTGIVFAENLAKKFKAPVIPVNHMLGHYFSVFADKEKFSISKSQFPILALLVSGGHTELILSKDFMKFKKIGETRDDAAGEAFDKVARLLGLPYPGGPEISRLAEVCRKNQESKIKLPRPMLNSPDFDFSFSGLKTAVLYLTQKIGKLTPKIKKEIAREFEDAVVDVLVSKTLRAAEKYKIKTLIVAGGVASNKHLRNVFNHKLQNTTYKLLFPARELATDNSLMIALAGYFQVLKNKKIKSAKNIQAKGNLKI